MSGKGEFSGRDREYDFAVGSIKGLRVWLADEEGRLRGVTYPAVWKPGENLSECAAVPKYCAEEACPLCKDERRVPKHNFDPECGCGFWAYDEVSFTPHGPAGHRVLGVIEGYGRTTIGTKGFRCEKARILALCRQDGPGASNGLSVSRWERLKALYPDAGHFTSYDDMVSAHPEVLKTWAGPGDDFWDVSDLEAWMTGRAIGTVGPAWMWGARSAPPQAHLRAAAAQTRALAEAMKAELEDEKIWRAANQQQPNPSFWKRWFGGAGS